MTDLIGRNPNQVPANNDLGEMAYQNRDVDLDNFRLGGVEGLKLLIKSWNPTYWFDYDDENTRNGSTGTGVSIYSKGTEAARLDSTNIAQLGLNGRQFWVGNGNSNARFLGTGLRTSWGYRTSYFFASAHTPNHWNSGPSGMYYADANAPYRVSVSCDSFGQNIGNGELSHHAGLTSGFDAGNTLANWRLGSNVNSGDWVINAVAGYFANWNDQRGGEQVRMCTLNRGTLGENLFNNNNNSSTNLATELYWGNRHSSDRGTTSRAYSEVILFCETMLNQDQYLILEHYFKIKYGGTQGRSR